MTTDIIIGSSVFFEGIEGYKAKDKDIMCIQPKPLPRGLHVLNMKKEGEDIFFWSPLSKEEWIEDTLTCGVPMRAGKFLVPQFVEYLGFTIEDLKRLEDAFNDMDEGHRYEKIIYDAYIKNGGFFLTEEQRMKAYEEYKKGRS